MIFPATCLAIGLLCASTAWATPVPGSSAPKPTAPRGIRYTFGTDCDEASGRRFRALGVTSVESYVTWQTCESEAQGMWDWSRWDRQVQVLKGADLKWVPFLIVGPAYATPGWFKKSKENVPCRCLEHGIDSEVQSLWNPNLPRWIDRFIGEFAKRYSGSGIIESVLLGVQGDYGEAIYSVSGGGWTGKYHQHQGYWCNDPYALADFRGFLRKKYPTAQALNAAWGTSYASISAADFPGRGTDLEAFRKRVEGGDPHARRRWLDFHDWYRASMTRWSDWWLSTARRYFPKTQIYLCTGGDASPEQGSDFGEQCRVAAEHDGGVWITNEGSHYALNCALTRWVASAGKHYGAYYSFEPAGAEDEHGIVARIYNATASGADRLFDYSGNVTQTESRIAVQRAAIGSLFRTRLIVPVALWYPNNVALTLNWYPFLDKALAFRDYMDFDFIDERMLRTRALDHYKALVILHGDVMETGDAALIADWIRKGGHAIVCGVSGLQSVEGTSDPETMLFSAGPDGRNLGRGWICRVNDQRDAASKVVGILRDFSLPVYDRKQDGIYGTQIGPRSFLFLNTGKDPGTVELFTMSKGREVEVPPDTIRRVDLD